MPSARLISNLDIAGLALRSTIVRAASGHIGHELTLPSAKAGTLSTRTSDTAGTLTLAENHGIETADKIDLYWAGGRRYNVTVGTVSGTSVPISDGAGDNLPAEDAEVTAGIRVTLDTDFDGDKLAVLATVLAQRGRLEFYDGDDALQLGLDLVAGEFWSWLSGGTAANPLASDVIDYVVVSTASPVLEAGFKLGALYESNT